MELKSLNSKDLIQAAVTRRKELKQKYGISSSTPRDE